MRIEMAQILPAIAVGVGAVLIMDGWNALLKRIFGVPSLDYCLLGRWVRHFPARFRHEKIAAAPPKSRECVTGWITHYSIGISLAVVFVQLVSGDWMARPTPVPPLIFGIATVAFPFFVMQPALGLGIASARTAKPGRARLKSLVTHTVFGAGLYLCALGGEVIQRIG